MQVKEDWKQDIKLLLEQSPIYIRLRELAQDDLAVNELLTILFNAVDYACDRTRLVIRHMDEYTLHDEKHLFRVLQHMARLIPDSTLKNLQPLELALLILSAFYHDIGMAPSERLVMIYKGLIDNNDLKCEEIQEKQEFDLFCKSNPQLDEKIKKCYGASMNGQAELLNNYRITEYIRRSHAKKSREIIKEIIDKEAWSHNFMYRDFKFGPMLASICESHNVNITELVKLPYIETSCLVATNEYVNSLFISIILRIADLLDFDAKRTPKVLYDHLGIKSPISIKEWQKHRSINAWIIEENKIAFSAKCSHPAIEKSIREFCKYIDYELFTCKNVLDNMHDQYRNSLTDTYLMALPLKVDTSQVKGDTNFDGEPIYNYKDLTFSLNQEQVVKLLMGTSLYGDESVAIRELIQNAVDTCYVRKLHEEVWERDYKPKIDIRIYSEGDNNYLEIEDNGMGMDEYIITNYFSSVGSSYYKSEEFYKTIAQLKKDYKSISKFGIGILSVFMIADSIDVETRRVIDRYDCSDPISLLIEGLTGFFWYKKGHKKEPGTVIKLTLKSELKNDLNLVEKYIKDLIKYIDVPIYVNGKDIHSIDEIAVDYKGNTYKYDAIRNYEIDIDEPCGLKGKVTVYLLHDNGILTSSKILSRYNVEVKGEDFDLEVNLKLSSNHINKYTDSIEVDEEGVNVNSSYSYVVQTEGKVYINGIRVNDSLFALERDWWKQGSKNDRKMSWPFPIKYDMNVYNECELNLTAARDKIICDDKWENFKIIFTKIVIDNLIKQLNEKDEIKLLKEIIETNSSINQEFIEIFQQVVANYL